MVVDWVMAEFDQLLPLAYEEVKSTEPPSQKVVGPLAVIVGALGFGFTVTVTVPEVEEHPAPFV
jgi:hypothetical protein